MVFYEIEDHEDDFSSRRKFTNFFFVFLKINSNFNEKVPIEKLFKKAKILKKKLFFIKKVIESCFIKLFEKITLFVII